MTKAQGRRSKKLAGYYDRQFAKTRANKIRHLQKRVSFCKSARIRLAQLTGTLIPVEVA